MPERLRPDPGRAARSPVGADDPEVEALAAAVVALLGRDDTVVPLPVGAVQREVERLVARLTRPGGERVQHQMRRARRHGALWAAGGGCPATLVAAYEKCFIVAQELLWARASPGDRAALRTSTRRVADGLQPVVDAVVAGHVAQRRSVRATDDALPALTALLLLGHATRYLDPPAECGLHVLVGASPDAEVPWQQRSFTAALRSAPAVAHCVHDGDLVVLAPRLDDPRVASLLDHPAGTRVWWGAVGPVAVRELPDALHRARCTARLAYGAGRPAATPTGPDRVAVEALVLADPVLRTRVDHVASTLTAQPELLRTVAALHAADFDRSRASLGLNVARRTLDGRLHRVRQVTGLGPTTSTGMQVHSLALTAVRLAEASWAP